MYNKPASGVYDISFDILIKVPVVCRIYPLTQISVSVAVNQYTHQDMCEMCPLNLKYWEINLSTNGVRGISIEFEILGKINLSTSE